MAGIPIDSPKPTDLQVARGRGETDAFDRLVPVVHDELRRIARRCMGRERPGHALQLTALVNEAYLRLIEAKAGPLAEPRAFLRDVGVGDGPHLVDAARAC